VNLRGKLDLLKRTSGGQPRLAHPVVNTRPAGACDHLLLEALGGSFCQTAGGPLHVTSHRYANSTRYGAGCLSGALLLAPETLSPLYSGLAGLCIKDALFFDTETTGLAGGSGTYAFLVGIGYYQGQEFVTEQLLMRDHGDEPALLEFLAERLKGRSGLVSFNGKTFDAQLLSTRYAMHRKADPLAHLAHLDLLHICRRLWGHSRLPDCRLETLEHRVLGAPRTDDTPGWMIPDLFFSFLRDRDPLPLKGVIEHNRRDLLAMVGLCGILQNLLAARCPETAPADPHVRLGLARLWSVLGNAELSDALYRSSITNPNLSEEARERGLTYWARDLKKRDRSEQAALLWRRLLAHYPGHLEATVELAKWFEHRRKDFRTALLLVEGGLRDRSLTATRRRELEHRASRLRTRLSSTPRDLSLA
jgi:uncharacterized protein YprB with RNaseH-like and TPR domain